MKKKGVKKQGLDYQQFLQNRHGTISSSPNPKLHPNQDKTCENMIWFPFLESRKGDNQMNQEAPTIFFSDNERNETHMDVLIFRLEAS